MKLLIALHQYVAEELRRRRLTRDMMRGKPCVGNMKPGHCAFLAHPSPELLGQHILHESDSLTSIPSSIEDTYIERDIDGHFWIHRLGPRRISDSVHRVEPVANYASRNVNWRRNRIFQRLKFWEKSPHYNTVGRTVFQDFWNQLPKETDPEPLEKGFWPYESEKKAEGKTMFQKIKPWLIGLALVGLPMMSVITLIQEATTPLRTVAQMQVGESAYLFESFESGGVPGKTVTWATQLSRHGGGICPRLLERDSEGFWLTESFDGGVTEVRRRIEVK